MTNKIIITTVGTSLFENYSKYRRDNEYDIPSEIEYLKESAKYNDWDSEQENIDRLREYIEEWLVEKEEDELSDCSAEIKSILKIKEEVEKEKTKKGEPKEKVEKVYFLCTETILSRLAAEIIQEKLKEKINIEFDPFKDVISGLLIDDYNQFNNTGFLSLLSRIDQIKGNHNNNASDQIILNITGGYKALNPIMTIIGQIENWDLKYIYEDSDSLLTISGNIPLNFDWDVIETLSSYLYDNEDDLQKLDNKIKEKLYNAKLLEKKGYVDKISIIGKLLKKYSNSESPLRSRVLGHYFELKLYQFFNDKVYLKYNSYSFLNYNSPEKKDYGLYYKIDESYNHHFVKGNQSGYKELGDYDLLLKDINGKPIITEVKGYFTTINDYYKKINTEDDYYFKIKARIEGYQFLNQKLPEIFLYIVHKPYIEDTIKQMNDDDFKNTISYFAKLVAQDYQGKVKFKCIGYHLPLRTKYLKIDYTTLLSKELKESNWENIN